MMQDQRLAILGEKALNSLQGLLWVTLLQLLQHRGPGRLQWGAALFRGGGREGSRSPTKVHLLRCAGQCRSWQAGPQYTASEQQRESGLPFPQHLVPAALS